MSEESEEMRELIEEGCERYQKILKQKFSAQKEGSEANSETSNKILDPKRSVTKGRSQRIKSGLHQNKKKKKSTSQSSQMREYGSSTPNPHII